MLDTPSRKNGAFWRGQIERATATRARYERWWDSNLKDYAPQASDDPDRWNKDVNTNRSFTLVERKKADLFYQRPDVTLQPTPLMDGPIPNYQGPPDPQSGQPTQIPMSTALSAHEEIVNESLGPDRVDATRMVHQTLYDVLCLQGVGFTKMGYESVTLPDPLSGTPVPIYENVFWQHFSGKRAVIPADFRSTEWDRAPFLGYQFELPLTPGNRIKYQLPPDFTGSKGSSDKLHYNHGADQTSPDDLFTGTELWYRSCLYRDDRPHPEHLTHLVLVDGIDEPVIEEDSPDQSLAPDGSLTPDSLIGFPIHPLNTRTLTDSAYPPSDVTMIRPLVNELNRFREQMVEYRDAQTLRWMYNTDTLPKEALEKIVRAPIGGMIGVPAEAFAGEGVIKELPHGSMPRESFTSNDYIDNDIARTTAIDASGAGVQSTGSTTATEQQIIAANANARLDFERGVVLQWYVKGVTKFSTLLQRYLPVQDAAKIVGPDRAAAWDAWRKAVPSSLAFTALPDSALRTDQAVDRKQAQDLYSYLANDPFIAKGRQKLLEKLLRKFHIDPAGIVSPPDPPKPEPPKLALSFKGEDLVGPQAPIVIEILKQQGITVSDAAIQVSQQALANQQQLEAAAAAEQAAGETTHGGKMPQQGSLDKHAAEQTGGMQGIGGQAAMGAPGGQLQ